MGAAGTELSDDRGTADFGARSLASGRLWALGFGNGGERRWAWVCAIALVSQLACIHGPRLGEEAPLVPQATQAGHTHVVQPGENLYRTVLLTVDAVLVTAHEFIMPGIAGERTQGKHGAGGHVLRSLGTGLLAHFVNDAGGLDGQEAEGTPLGGGDLRDERVPGRG